MNNKPIAYMGQVLVLASFLATVVLFSLDRGDMPRWLNPNAAAWGCLAVCVVGLIFGVIGWKTTPGKVAACMGGALLVFFLAILLSVAGPRRPSPPGPPAGPLGRTGAGARGALGRGAGP